MALLLFSVDILGQMLYMCCLACGCQSSIPGEARPELPVCQNSGGAVPALSHVGSVGEPSRAGSQPGRDRGQMEQVLLAGAFREARELIREPFCASSGISRVLF